MSPTSNVNVPAGCAIVVFLYYQFQGLRKQGLVTYLKHFMGPVWWLAPLMVPIELISHFARPATLTIRLFANIMAEELVIAIFFGLFPFIVPLAVHGFCNFRRTSSSIHFLYADDGLPRRSCCDRGTSLTATRVRPAVRGCPATTSVWLFH